MCYSGTSLSFSYLFPHSSFFTIDRIAVHITCCRQNTSSPVSDLTKLTIKRSGCMVLYIWVNAENVFRRKHTHEDALLTSHLISSVDCGASFDPVDQTTLQSFVWQTGCCNRDQIYSVVMWAICLAKWTRLSPIPEGWSFCMLHVGAY